MSDKRLVGGRPMLAALLLLAGVGLVALLATVPWSGSEPAVPADAIPVVMTGDACRPADHTVAAGSQSLVIANRGASASGWQLLAGGIAVTEIEAVPAGASRVVSARLWPGEYTYRCGRGSALVGTLRVMAVEAGEADPREATRSAVWRLFAAPVAAYRQILERDGQSLAAEVDKLRAAIAAGDLGEARTLFLAAGLPFDRLEAVALRFPELVERIEPLAEAFPGREGDPAFKGFHRLEYGLFSKASTSGLEPVVEDLAAAVAELRTRMASLPLDPKMLTASAAILCDRLASGEIVLGQNHYAKTDIADISGNLDGIAAIVDALRPGLQAAAPDRLAAVDAETAKMQAAMAKLAANGRFISYDTVEFEDRGELSAGFNALAGVLDKLESALDD
ncbi:imelysin family protein [Aurantimonas sp. VKM B-3413]|uniref:imelysin family protein n=1 Tax=Aurantimonas sp. VKM B-3413 TaxID=2779401 RepID=UPI001E3C2426|nr:imelysin family protein [Aurantimonas sp. VKM B-3413]MCB8838265.1 hypothetical protein [Aurantimonas sp. VKM B-3413]